MIDLDQVANRFRRGLKSYVRSWPGRIDPPGVIRASGIHFLCPNKFFYNYWMPSEIPSMDFEGSVFTGQGTFLHSFLQDIVLGTTGVLKGTWSVGEEIVTDSFMPVEFAELQLRQFCRQEKHPVKYKEYWYYDEHWGLSGHCDGVVSLSRLEEAARLLNLRTDHPGLELRAKLEDVDPCCKGYALIEVKTTNAFKFKNLESADNISPWYKAQATIYQKLSGIDTTVFLYLDRDSAALKTVVFKSTDEDWKTLKKKLVVIWESIRDEEIISGFEACQTPEDKPALECPFVKRCFKENPAKAFIRRARREQPDRRWLDLKGWKAGNNRKIGGWLEMFQDHTG